MKLGVEAAPINLLDIFSDTVCAVRNPHRARASSRGVSRDIQQIPLFVAHRRSTTLLVV
jgi:hypothetical protein